MERDSFQDKNARQLLLGLNVSHGIDNKKWQKIKYMYNTCLKASLPSDSLVQNVGVIH
jgi:hypothetical protein